MRIKSVFAILACMFLFNSCGGGHGQISVSSAQSYGSANLAVTGSKNVSNSSSYSSIKRYIVSVTGPDISEPIQAEFDGTAEEGSVSGIPAGEGRIITVVAVNERDQNVREGASTPVTVVAGAVQDVIVDMQAIPVFANIMDGNHISSRRLNFEIFTDPEDRIEVLNCAGDLEAALYDIATDSSEINADLATGIAHFRPKNISSGVYTFMARSKRTGKSSTVKINVLDGSKISPAPIFAGGVVGSSVDAVQAHALGSGLVAWPLIVKRTVHKY